MVAADLFLMDRYHDEFGQSSVSYTYGDSDGVSVMMDANHTTVRRPLVSELSHWAAFAHTKLCVWKASRGRAG